MKEEKVNKEQAQKELNDFFAAMDIDIVRNTPDGKLAVQALNDLIIHHIMAGHVIFNEDNEPVVMPWRTEGAKPLTIKEPTGGNLMAAGVEESALKASLLVLAELTCTSIGALSKLKGVEISLLRAFYTFFTA